MEDSTKGNPGKVFDSRQDYFILQVVLQFVAVVGWKRPARAVVPRRNKLFFFGAIMFESTTVSIFWQIYFSVFIWCLYSGYFGSLTNRLDRHYVFPFCFGAQRRQQVHCCRSSPPPHNGFPHTQTHILPYQKKEKVSENLEI